MKRTTISALVGCLLLGTLGCCNPCCQRGLPNRMGCGKMYVSDWYDGLGCDPCDDCGNWTGGCRGCSRPWLDHWRFGCGGWYFPGLYGGAYGSRCQRCCGGPCGQGTVYDDGYDGYHGDGAYDGAVMDQGVIYDGPQRDKPTPAATTPDSSSPLLPPSSASSQQGQRQWRSLKTNR